LRKLLFSTEQALKERAGREEPPKKEPWDEEVKKKPRRQVN